jgi:cell shape-determining protein MreC
MSFLKLGFLDFSDIIFLLILVLIAIFFLREFKLTSKRSWLVLLGLTALGGLFAFRAWRRKQLLKQFEEREKRLREIEQRYQELKNKAQISDEAYKKAREELDRARIQTGLAVMRADEELAEDVRTIETDYQTMTVEESVKRIKNAIRP